LLQRNNLISIFSNLRFSVCSTSFNNQKIGVLPTMDLYILLGSQNKQRLFVYITLTVWFL